MDLPWNKRKEKRRQQQERLSEVMADSDDTIVDRKSVEQDLIEEMHYFEQTCMDAIRNIKKTKKRKQAGAVRPLPHRG